MEKRIALHKAKFDVTDGKAGEAGAMEATEVDPESLCHRTISFSAPPWW